MTYDVGVVGAGVEGCGIAERLVRKRPDLRVAVFEKLNNVGLETSRYNSGVLHSGLHQEPGSLKARFAYEGSAMAVAYLQEKRLPIKHTGMLIAVPSQSLQEGLWRESSSLYHLVKRGWEQGINFEFLTPWGVRRLEPNIEALGGIFIPNVWVIDPVSFVQALYEDAKSGGAQFFFRNEITKIVVTKNSYVLNTPFEEVEVKILINAAGLYADDVARLAGVPGYKIFPWRGEYYEVCEEKRNLVNRLVYPVVPANSPGKGIHFSPRVDGRLFIGPNARPVPRKDYYNEDITPKKDFLEAVGRFCPMLEEKDLTWAYSGIRAKLSDTPHEDDFIIRLDRTSPPLLNLVGIESPGLASSLAIAEHVSEMLSDFLPD